MSMYPSRGLHGQVVQALGSRILMGDLPSGSILDIEAIGEELDVSRTVIRESIKVLAGKGLVGSRPRRGTFVRDRKDWNLLDPDVLRWQFQRIDDEGTLERLAEVRFMIEPGAAALAAHRRSDADVAAIEGALADLVANERDTAAFIEADVRFHRAVFAATHNEFLEQMAIVIIAGLESRDAYVHPRVSAHASLTRHRRVFEAICARDSGGAERAVTLMLSRGASDARKVLKKTETARV